MLFRLSDAVFIMLKYVKMPTIVDFNIFEHYKLHAKLELSIEKLYNPGKVICGGTAHIDLVLTYLSKMLLGNIKISGHIFV